MSADGKLISRLDRRWMGTNGVIMMTGVRTRPVEQVRALLTEYLRRCPHHALAGRIDRAGRRWVAVSEADRAAHVKRLVIAVDDPDPDDLDGHVRTHIAALTPDLPLFVAVSPHSLFIILCHGVGDGVTLDRIATTLLAADTTEEGEVVSRLAALEPRIDLSLAVREFARGLPRHRRDWFAHIANPLRRRPGRNPAPAAQPAGPSRPAFAGAVVTNEQLRGLLQWRNREAPKASIAAVLTSATYRALAGQGLDVDPGGYYAILDLRQFLPDDSPPSYGNGAKSLHVTADLTDPQSISTALKQANEERRVLPAIALRSPMRRRTLSPTPARRGGQLALTFTFQPTSAELPRVPAAGDLPRSLYGFGTPASPGGVAVFAVRLRQHLQLTASFDESTVPMETVRLALATLTDPRSILEGSHDRITSG